MPAVTTDLHLDLALTGLVLGAVGAGLVAALGTRRTPAVVLVVATAASGLAVAIATSGRLSRPPSAASLGATAGAVLVAGTGQWLLGRAEGPAAHAWLVGLVPWSAAVGGFLAVPDTEGTVAVLAAMTPIYLLVVSVAARRVATAPWLAWTAVLVPLGWALAWGARGRVESLPGALSGLGVALAAPLLWRVAVRVPPTALAAIQVGAVIAGSRWAARATGSSTALTRSAVVVAGVYVAVAVVVLVSVRSGEPGHRPPSPPDPRPR